MPFPILPPPLQRQLDQSQHTDTKTRMGSRRAPSSANPDFVELYQWLTSEVLGSDGSVLKPDLQARRYVQQPGEEEADGGESTEPEADIDEILKRLWIERTKDAVPVRVLRETALSSARFEVGGARGSRRGEGGGEMMTDHVKRLCYLVAVYLSISGARREGISRQTGAGETIDKKDNMDDLMKHDLDQFRHLLPSLIGPAVSVYIEDIEHTLRKMLEVVNIESLGPTMLDTHRSTTKDIMIPPNNPTKTPATTTSSQLVQSLDKALLTTNQNLLFHQSSLNLDISDLLAIVTPSNQPSHAHQPPKPTSTFSPNPQVRDPHSHYLTHLTKDITLTPHSHIPDLAPAQHNSLTPHDQTPISSALTTHHTTLETKLDRLAERERELSAILAEYDAAGVSESDGGREPMRELGEKYRGIEAEIENVKREVEGLERRL